MQHNLAMDKSPHLSMEHGGGHGNHGDHGGSDSTCTMHTALTWSYKDTCVLFSSWHIKKPIDLVVSMFAIMVLAYFYEYLKYYIYKFQLNQSSTSNTGGQRRYNLAKSVWYGVQVGFSFMLMLIFMTYNGWLMLSVVAGAIWGNYHWGSRVKSCGVQELSCH